MATEIIEMSIIRKPLGYKDGDLKCSFVLFVTHVTRHYLKYQHIINTTADVKIVTEYWSNKFITQLTKLLIMPN